MARINSNGQLDTTFGSGGLAPLVVLVPVTIALQQNGQILIASGGFRPAPLPFPLSSSLAGSLARYNANGSLDKNFGILGQAASLAAPSALAVQVDGRILAAGFIISHLELTGNGAGSGLVRYNSNGSIDTTFGTQGGVVTGFPNLSLAEVFALAIQLNGDIVAAGDAGSVAQFTESFALTRYLSTGQLDTTFGTGGRVTTSLGSTGDAFIAATVLQGDGKIVAVGSNGGGSFEVARYLAQ